ncbi:hypothetical protein ACWEFL_32430 [Streptomyces sp. NPDC004838]
MHNATVQVPDGWGLSPQEYADRATGLYARARAAVAAHTGHLREAAADTARETEKLTAAVARDDLAAVEAGMARLFTLTEAVLAHSARTAPLHDLLGTTPPPAARPVDVPRLREEDLPPLPEGDVVPPGTTLPTEELLRTLEELAELRAPVFRERFRLATEHFTRVLDLLPRTVEQPAALSGTLAEADAAWALWHETGKNGRPHEQTRTHDDSFLNPPTYRERLDAGSDPRDLNPPRHHTEDEDGHAAERARHQRQIAAIDRYARADDATGTRFRAFMDTQLQRAGLRRVVTMENRTDFGTSDMEICSMVAWTLLTPAYRTTDTDTLVLRGKAALVEAWLPRRAP